jgi:hypothetical protein
VGADSSCNDIYSGLIPDKRKGEEEIEPSDYVKDLIFFKAFNAIGKAVAGEVKPAGFIFFYSFSLTGSYLTNKKKP